MIQQTAYYIPADIAVGLTTGDLVRYGGVVRRASGEIYKHLKEIDLPKTDTQRLQVPQGLRNPWVFSPLVASGVLAGGTAAYVLVKRHRRTKALLGEYREALASYVGALQEGRLDAAIIDRLSSSLAALTDDDSGTDDAVRESLDQEALKLTLIVVDSTQQLARDNGLNEPADETSVESTSLAPVIQLRRHLEVQRSLFDRAA